MLTSHAFTYHTLKSAKVLDYSNVVPPTILPIYKSLLAPCFILRSLYYSYMTKSRLTIVSREAKKKQAVRDEQVSYLHVAPL